VSGGAVSRQNVAKQSSESQGGRANMEDCEGSCRSKTENNVDNMALVENVKAEGFR
jgi:hypothetical protein